MKAVIYLIAAFFGIQLLFVFFCFIVTLFIDNEKPLEKQNKVCLFCCHVIAMVGCGYLGVRFHMTGEEKIPENSKFLFVCNHRSGFDPFSNIWNLRKYNISYISKPSNLSIPIGGKLSYGAGFLPIDRENDRKALKTILQATDYIKKDICSIGVYPEGTRSKTGEVLPFRAGAFKIAQKAKVPVVIASTHGTENATKNMFRRCTDVYLDIIEVVDIDTVQSMSTKNLSEYARDRIIESINNR